MLYYKRTILACGIKESFMPKKFVPVLSALMLLFPVFALAQTYLNCGSDGISAMCAINPDPVQQNQQNQRYYNQLNQQYQQTQQQLDQQINNLKMRYGVSNYYTCVPQSYYSSGMAGDPWYDAATFNQTQSCLEQKEIAKQQAPPACPAGTAWYKGQCTDNKHRLPRCFWPGRLL